MDKKREPPAEIILSQSNPWKRAYPRDAQPLSSRVRAVLPPMKKRPPVGDIAMPCTPADIGIFPLLVLPLAD